MVYLCHTYEKICQRVQLIVPEKLFISHFAKDLYITYVQRHFHMEYYITGMSYFFFVLQASSTSWIWPLQIEEKVSILVLEIKWASPKTIKLWWSKIFLKKKIDNRHRDVWEYLVVVVIHKSSINFCVLLFVASACKHNIYLLYTALDHQGWLRKITYAQQKFSASGIAPLSIF